MKQIIKLIATVLITVLFVPIMSAQNEDNTVIYDNIDISLKYDQGILRKDPETGKYVSAKKETLIDGISAVTIKNEIIFIPQEEKSVSINKLNAIFINTGKKDYGKGMLTGSLLGFLAGAATMMAVIGGDDSWNNSTGLAVASIITGAFTLAGLGIGTAFPPEEYKEIKLDGYENSAKQKLIIESLNKSKVQGL